MYTEFGILSILLYIFRHPFKGFKNLRDFCGTPKSIVNFFYLKYFIAYF